MALGPGELLTENLRLERELGQGAMGTVWAAEQLSLGSKIAVKVLRRSGPLDEEARERFAQEARRVAKIDSPHVVKILDYGVSAGGEPFIAMELLRGSDLGRYVDERGPLAPAATAEIVDQLCRALSAAHEAGVVHRDIKPANVFISDNDGEPFVTLLDFGVAKSVRDVELSLTATGALMGTPYFMSPEQFMGRRDVDARSDLWSVAVLAYSCLTGKLPFRGDSVVVISMAAHAGVFQPPSRLRDGLTPALDAWFERAFAVERGDRFPTARVLAESFAAAVEGDAPPSLVDPMGSTAVASRRDGAALTELGSSTAMRRRPASTHGGISVATANANTGSAATASGTTLSGTAAPTRLLWVLGSIALVGLLASAVSITYIVARSGDDARIVRTEAPPRPEPSPLPTPSPSPSAPESAVAPRPTIPPEPIPSQAPVPSSAPSVSVVVKAPKPATIHWRSRGTGCVKDDEYKACVPCCNEGDRLAPYPVCECMFDGDAWDRAHGRAP